MCMFDSGTYNWKKGQKPADGTILIMLMNREDLKLKSGEREDEPHRPMCRQVLGIDVTSFLDEHKGVALGFEIREDRFYWNSSILNTSKHGSHEDNGFTDADINLGEIEA